MSKPYDLAAALRAIRAECHNQGIDDDARRALMLNKAGVTSQTKLDATGARAVLDHLRKSGGASTAPKEWGFVDKAPPDRVGRLRYIIVLCGQLGIRRGGQKRYVEGIAENMDGTIRQFKDGRYIGEKSKAVKKALEFCTADELGDIVNALEKQVTRKQARDERKPA